MIPTPPLPYLWPPLKLDAPLLVTRQQAEGLYLGDKNLQGHSSLHTAQGH